MKLPGCIYFDEITTMNLPHDEITADEITHDEITDDEFTAR